MKQFLANLIRFNLTKFSYETNKYFYVFNAVEVDIDIFFIELSFMITFWFTRESVAEREARMHARLDKMNESLERWLLEIQEEEKAEKKARRAKAVTKKPAAKKAPKKEVAKKAPAKKAATKKTAKK